MRHWVPAGALAALAMCVCAAGFAGPACAAPSRLNDDVPDAVPDIEGTWSLSYGLQSLDLEGPLSNATSTHNYYKLRYALNPDVEAAVFYETHSLAGELGLISPVFNNHDAASGYGFDLGINLLNQPSKYADPADPKSFTAGSAFGIGVNLSKLNLSAGTLDQDDSLMKAYLVYSTDLTDHMRAHTYFSTGRISGDTHTGSMNRVAAGIDYTLTSGARPLVLMADAVLDIYNFRQPTFNTSRISSFDVGLRYALARDWYASLGYTTYNDSENDASGSGLFASVQFIDQPGSKQKCDVILPAPDHPGPPADQPAAALAPVPAEPGPPPVAPQDTTLPTETPAPARLEPAATIASPVPESTAAEPAPPEQPAIAPPAVPAETPLILPDGRANAPLRERFVSSLRNEFSHAASSADEDQSALAESDAAQNDAVQATDAGNTANDTQPESLEPPAGYDPLRWADDSDESTAAGTADESEDGAGGIDIPALDSVRASKDQPGNVSRDRRKARAASSAKPKNEKPQPDKEDDGTVEVQIGPPPAEDEDGG